MRLEDMKAEYMDSMLRAKKGYARVLEPICKQQNLTRNEMDILLFLSNNPEFDRAADIVARRGIAKSHVSLSVGNLEERGLITRRYDEGDRRTAHLQLSEEARAIAQEGREAQVRFFSRVYAGLTQEELTKWQEIMMKVSQNILNMEDI